MCGIRILDVPDFDRPDSMYEDSPGAPPRGRLEGSLIDSNETICSEETYRIVATGRTGPDPRRLDNVRAALGHSARYPTAQPAGATWGPKAAPLQLFSNSSV
jgi:hypothetical protein